MSEPTAKSIEIAREAASVAAFRMVYAFLAFGAVDLFAAIARWVATVALPPPRFESMEITSALGSAWGAACIAIVIAACALRFAMIVSLHRRRLIRAEPLSLWIGAGLFGIFGRVAATAVSYGQTAWIGRTFGTEALATWSITASGAGVADLLLDAAFGVVLLVMTALAVQRDRQRPDPPEDYRSPGRT